MSDALEINDAGTQATFEYRAVGGRCRISDNLAYADGAFKTFLRRLFLEATRSDADAHSRADAVGGFLRSKGMDNAKIATTSRGELDATGSDEAGWARDRRVDLMLGQ